MDDAIAESTQSVGAANVNMADMMGDVTNLAVDAITKEMKYESFAEQEELQREQSNESKGRSEVEEVADKMECLKRLER